MRILFYIHIVLFSLLYTSTQGQSIITEFGKNRVQYHDDHYNWNRYETENFTTYWYGKGRNIAQPVIQLAELDHEDIQKTLEHTLSNKIEIIVYTDLSDLLQSNIGSDEAFTNKSKETKVHGNKIMVYFDGNHQNLRLQIRKGIASIYMNSILYGSNFQEIVQNALLLNLPSWFSEGMNAYAGSHWDRYIDDELRDLMSIDKYRDFDKLAEDHPRVAGQSLWNYISQTYGSATIANIVYLTRISRNLENSFLFILGDEFEIIKEQWLNFYALRYAKEDKAFSTTEKLDLLKLKNKKGIPVSTFRISPDGKNLAYITNDKNKVKIYVRDLKHNKDRLVKKLGYKNVFQEPDYNYPLIAWHPTYPELTIIYEERDVAKLMKLDLKNNTSEVEDLTTNFQRVYSLAYIRNDEYLLSGTTDGYSDLYIYKADNRHHIRITEDFYDDLEAEVITYQNSPAVLFKSNRPNLSLEKNKLDTILPVEHFDLFLLKGLDSESELIQLTTTKNISERQAFQSSTNEITYIHGHSGIDNAYTLDLESRQTSPVTNLERNLITHHATPTSDAHFFNYYFQGNYINLEGSLAKPTKSISETTYSKISGRQENGVQVPFLPKEEPTQELNEGMKFQSPFDDVEDLQPLEESQDDRLSESMFEKYFKDYFSESYLDGKRIVKFVPMRASASRERFRLDEFVSKFDNTVLFEGLESYTGENKELATQPAGILIKGVIKDLLEDYEINVGLRVPTRLNGYEYFVTLDDNKRLWDKRLAFYRKSTVGLIDPDGTSQREKRHTFLTMYRLKYPLDVYQSFRLTTSLRFDKYFLQSTELRSYNADYSYEKRLSLKGEYVFDNSFDVSLNIMNGSRAKVFAEVINEFDMDLNNGLNLDLSKGVTSILGFDARHYIPILKRAVLALRATAATSFGSKRVVYYLGGMESWLFSKPEPNIPVPAGDNTAYKVLAPQLRGFGTNIRNGNSYVLSNIEFRLPLAPFLGLEKSKLGFIRNLQVTSFFDAGVAWFGTNPNSAENTLNSVYVANPEDNPLIIIEARYFRDPLVLGYGFGARTTMLGYFLKLDYGWGVETGQQRSPKIYLSMGLDF